MIDFAPLMETLGDAGAATAVGAALGLAFGFVAQRSRFCLRSASIEVAEGRPGVATAVWLAAFGAAILACAIATINGAIATQSIMIKVNPASLSGALAGGAMFGIGMVLARGCASRHLVLAATGNLRAWVTIGLFAAIALATISGPLAPLRRAISGLLVISPATNDAVALAGLTDTAAVALGALALAVAAAIAFVARRGAFAMIGGAIIGGGLAIGWVGMSALASQTFETTTIATVSFTAPLAHLLSDAGSAFATHVGFDGGLVGGVVVGAALAAILFGEFRLQWFPSLRAAVRYLLGAVLMGVGGVLALGCSVGTLSNTALMVTTSWAALAAMWAGAMATHRLLDGATRPAARTRRELETGLPSHATTI